MANRNIGNMTFTAPIIDKLVADIQDSVNKSVDKEKIVEKSDTNIKSKKRTLDQMSKGEETDKVSDKSALKQPTRIFKMPAPKQSPVMSNPFKMSESVETFGAKQKSIDTIRKRSSIGESEAANKLSEEKAPKKSLPEDEVKKAQEAMRNMFKSLQKPKGEN